MEGYHLHAFKGFAKVTDIREEAQRLAIAGHTVTYETVYKPGSDGKYQDSEMLHHYSISCMECLRKKQETDDGKISGAQG